MLINRSQSLEQMPISLCLSLSHSPSVYLYAVSLCMHLSVARPLRDACVCVGCDCRLDNKNNIVLWRVSSAVHCCTGKCIQEYNNKNSSYIKNNNIKYGIQTHHAHIHSRAQHNNKTVAHSYPNHTNQYILISEIYHIYYGCVC